MGVFLKYWQEVLNPRSYGYHKILETTKPNTWG